jgi:Cu/Ag efflux pump CusA
MVTAELTEGEARANIMRTLEDEFFPDLEARYPSVTRRAIGQAESQAEFMNQLQTYGLMALFGMYFLLAVVFRSYAQPALIMTVIPFAFVGAVVGHFTLGISFALFSYFGMIAAMGVVVNDNVVLLNRANQIRGYFMLRRRGAGGALPEGEVALEHTGPNGEAFEVISLDEELEIEEDDLRAAIGGNFAKSTPMELRSSHHMVWEKSDLRERTEALEAAGFQLVRVRAEYGIIGASVSRFRQIFLTSITEFTALLPMLLENAAIVQFLKPMALALAFGVLLCMPVTLLLTPALYMIGVDIKRGVSGVVGFYGRLYGGRRDKLAAAE